MSGAAKSQYHRLLFNVGPAVPLFIGFIAVQTYPIWGRKPPSVQSPTGFDITRMNQKELDQFYDSAPEHVRKICRDRFTERAYPATLHYDTYYKNTEDGVYVSAVSGLPLFDSDDKYDSGTGWPSFSEVIDDSHFSMLPDFNLGYERTEVMDRKSQAHLGHVFDDPSSPSGRRYCINGGALKFIPRAEFNELYPEYESIKQQRRQIPKESDKSDL